ncbi:KDELC1 [Bugula neritina]|uniref:KDELC1 n=1 Tax=Bugula neritina TaxID=10212 RepID=A0A7J7JVW6_BUGNE|nr:KDELC1 [Bugula neritina]
MLCLSIGMNTLLLVLVFGQTCSVSVAAESRTHSHTSKEYQYKYDHLKTKIWGPGLNSKAQLPSSYFYVELYLSNGTRYPTSAGPLEVLLTPGDGGKFRGRSSVIDRKDGSYIVNYRPVMPVRDLSISVLLDGQHLGQSPFLLPGWIYQENCNCPSDDTNAWLKALQCPESFDMLDEDLRPFSDLDMRKVEADVYKRWPKRQGSGALMHYIVKDNRVYRKEVGTICGFKMFSDAILLSLARKVKLPDVEFFINLGDWPLVKKSSTSPLPIFSWCGSDSTSDIILPTYDVTDSTLKSLSQVSLDMFTVQGTDSPNWSQKIPKALFRGRDSRKERLELVKLARRGNNSQLIDAGITAFFFFPKDEQLTSERINFFDFFKYKYQLNIDGTVAAYRFPYLMAADSLVLKQDSEYYEFFYKELQPWKHYVPVKRDLSDVVQQVKWAIDHDEEAEEIARNGRTRTRELVTPANIYCYYYKAFLKLSSLIKSKIEVQEGMEEAQHSDYFSHCQCQRSSSQRPGDEL